MKSNYDNVIPVVIQQLIENVDNKNTSQWTRENYCVMLERIRNACDAAITKFNKEKTLVYEKTIKRKAK
jgi:RPA family protein